MENLVAKVLLAAIVLGSALGQQKAQPKPGAISGRVFAITGGGDLKPARMAKVYLFLLQPNINWRQATDREKEEAENSAGMAWFKERTKAGQHYLEELKREGGSWTDSILCRKHLLSYESALVEVLKLGKDASKAGQILTADADEEGVFKVLSVRPGRYILAARGRAGGNEALWLNEDTNAESGAETTIKLASPEKACLSIP